MRLFAGNPAAESALWTCMALFAILMFLFAAMDLILLLIQKRYRWLWLAAPLLCLSYFMEQCFDMAFAGSGHSQAARRIVACFAALPDWLLLASCLAMAAALVLLFGNIHSYEQQRITGTSVKEAMDSLPGA